MDHDKHSASDFVAGAIDRQWVIGETPNGDVNGANATFTTDYNFVPETVALFVNGLIQKKPIDFNTSGQTTILTAFSPEHDDVMLVNYLRD